MLGFPETDQPTASGVRCRRCGIRNLGIDIWCAWCRHPLDWQPDGRPRTAAGITHPFLGGLAPLAQRHRGTVSALAAALALLAIVVTVAMAQVPIQAKPGGQVLAASTHRSTVATVGPFQTALDAAIAAAMAKTGLAYAAQTCQATEGCLTQPVETDGASAAYVKFSTAHSGSTACLAYVIEQADSWQPFDVACGPADTVTPARGQRAAVVPQGGCVNVRDTAGFGGAVVNCLAAGAAVTIDDGPAYADRNLWWHLQDQGWTAHEFLVPG